ncbi:MAG: GH3 auxin-responsive promoter family protein [Candidatus Omnitrophota bacterium]
MNIASLAVKAHGLKAHMFERALKDPFTSQKKVLAGFLSRNKNTRYGREYGFRDIRSIDDYRSRVPLNDYETLRPYVDCLMRGEENVLTADKVTLFGVTSGTMGKPKHIPVTEYSRRNKKDVMDLWAYYALRDHPGLLDGKILAIVSPEKEGFTISKIPFGAESGHAYRNLPQAVRNLYAIPYEVFEIPDYESKYYCILRIAAEENISTIATLNPSTILLLCQRMEKVGAQIIEDIRLGALNKKLNVCCEIREKIEARLTPNPKRADELSELAKKRNGELLPMDIWPNLKLIECWKGGSVGVYISYFSKYFGPNTAIRDFGYLSSEARVSIPMCDSGCGGVLAINSNFYEFVPRNEMDKDDKRFLLSHELGIGKEYYIILTTPGGLYRYNIDDIIRVSGFYKNTPVIEFVQKGSIVSSVTGEKIYEMQIDEAVNKAAGLIGANLQFFSACVEWQAIPRYAFIVEFMNDLSREGKVSLLKSIENQLIRLNVEYDTKRRSQRLGSPVLKVVAQGTFEEYRSRRVQQGSHDGQIKIPKLVTDVCFQNNFKILEEIAV